MRKKNSLQKDKILRLPCECGTELLHVETDKEYKNFYLCFYKYGQRTFVSWQNQLRLIWQIVKTGSPFGDMIMLNYKEAKKLSKFLEKEAK